MKSETKNKLEGVKLIVEIIGIPLGIVGGVIGAFMLVAQYKEMVRATNATLDAVKVSKAQIDDSEAQQRAWLRIESLNVRRVATNAPGKYSVDVAMVLKNFGVTPAIDLYGSGITIPESIERFNKTRGLTNSLNRWNREPRTSTPGNGGVGIMPQETFTNKFVMGEFQEGDDFYIESWLSYRDIFRKPWIIGEGGTYHFTNDSFSPDFINYGQFREVNPTNAPSKTKAAL